MPAKTIVQTIQINRRYGNIEGERKIIKIQRYLYCDADANIDKRTATA